MIMKYLVQVTMQTQLKLEVEANSKDEARNKIVENTMEELTDMADNVVFEDYKIDSIELSEATYHVRATNIKYDISEYDVSSDLSPNEVDDEIERIKDSLPARLVLTVTGAFDEVEELVTDKISDMTGWLVDSLDITILDER